MYEININALLKSVFFFWNSDCDNDDLITNLRSCVNYTMKMTAFELGGNGKEQYQAVYVSTLEGSKFYHICRM